MRFEYLSIILIKGFGYVGSFFLTVLITNNVSPQIFGSYAYAITVLNLMVSLTLFGTSNYVIKETSISISNPQVYYKVWEKLFSFITYTILIVFLASCLAIKVLNPANPFALLIFILPVLVLLQFNLAKMQGLFLVKTSQFIDLIFRPTLFVTFFIIQKHILNSTPYVSISFSFVISYVASLLLSKFVISKNIASNSINKINITSYANLKSIKNTALVLAPFGIVQVIQMLNSSIDTLFVEYFFDYEVLANYRITLTIASITTFSLIPIGLIVKPRIAKAYKEGNFREIETIVGDSSFFAFILTIFMVFFAWLTVLYLVPDIFGSGYEAYLGCFYFLALAMIVNSLFTFSGLVMLMVGAERIMLICVLLALLVNLTVNLLLVNPLGYIGVAVGNLLAMTTWNLGCFYYLKIYKNINVCAIRF